MTASKGEYDNERDQRECPHCDFVAYGGSTATYWELYDHETDKHGRECTVVSGDSEQTIALDCDRGEEG